MEHVAILMRPYLEAILDGRKTIESRLTVTNRAPYGRIGAGDVIHFKESAGPYRARAVAERVEFEKDLTPTDVRRLRDRYNERIMGDAEFWEWKSNAKFATLIWLKDVRATWKGPAIRPQRGIAWLCVKEKDGHAEARTGWRVEAMRSAAAAEWNGVIEIPVTAGAVRNHYLSLRGVIDRFPADAVGGKTRATAGRAVTLNLPDGEAIRTDIVGEKKIFRARREFGRWFAAQAAKAGDRVVLAPRAGRRYAVRLVRGGHEEGAGKHG